MILLNNRDKVEWENGMTVRDLFKKMSFNYELITVFVNDEYVAPDDYDHSIIPDNADVKAIHIAHGG